MPAVEGVTASLDGRVEEAQFSLEWSKRKGLAVAEHETEFVEVPRVHIFFEIAPGRNAIHQGASPDDAATLKLVGLRHRDIGECVANPAIAFTIEGESCMNEKIAAELRAPGSVLDSLVTVDDEPGPRLADRQRSHRTFSKTHVS